MKKIVKIIFVSLFLVLITPSLPIHAVNIPHVFGCDTIFLRGNYAQIKQIETNILNELKKPVNPIMKAALYSLMGDTKVALGRYADALTYYKQGVTLFEAIDFSLEKNAIDRYYYASCLNSYSKLQLAMGEAEPILDNIMQTVEQYGKWIDYAKDYAPSHPQTLKRMSYALIHITHLCGTLQFLHREFTSGIEEYEECIQNIKGCFGDEAYMTKEYVEVLLSIGDIYERIGDNEKALSYFNQSLQITEKIAGENSINYAQILTRIASLYYTLNDLVKASELSIQCVEIYERNGFTEHAELGNVASVIGMILLNEREYNLALEYSQQGYDMQKNTCGETNYRTVVARSFCTWPLMMLGRLDEAWTLIGEVLDAPSLLGNVYSDSFLNTLILACDIGLLRQEYDEIIDLQKNLAELIEVYGTVSQLPLRNMYLNLGRAHRRKGDYKNAVVQFNKTLDIQRTIAHDNFSFLTEEQRSKLWAVDETRINSLFCANQADKHVAPEIGGLLYDVALLNKGILLQASINLAEVVRNSGDEALKRKLSDFRLLKQELAATGKGETEEAKRMESEIVQAAKKYGDFMEYTNLTWQDVKQHLGDNDVAIEFVSSLYGGIYTYSAEVIRKNMTAPRHIKLFTVTANQLSLLHASPGEYSLFSGKHIWTAELLQFLTPGDNVYFVPSGELYNIGIEYIPLPNGKRMCDVYQMHRLSSTREIVTTHAASSTHTGVLFGGLNYNSSLSDMELYAYAVATRGDKQQRFTLQTSNALTTWNYLPGTIKEVTSIAASLQNYRYAIHSYTGNEGVEEAFKALSNKQTEIIHIATHGFYQPNKGDDLQNSGLIFAGANNFWKSQSDNKNSNGMIDDGILTAKEISLLNLQGTDLLVMSACQTGLGKVTGEGVFGLQRAFKKAGVQTLLMSLWEVDDEATQLMMSEFYKAFAAGQSKREALKIAQNKVKQHTFHRNGKPVSGSDPYYWAAFIMMD